MSDLQHDLRRATVVTALADMVKKGHFSICTIDSCADILGVQSRGSEPYRILRALHCIDFAAMPPIVREALPGLIRQCLGVELPEPESPAAGKVGLLQRLKSAL
jgi:hypothetical protein